MAYVLPSEWTEQTHPILGEERNYEGREQMPDFTRAEISNTTTDLTAYVTFLKKLSRGQTVTLPLEAGETPRTVMRAINAAAVESELRLARLDSPSGTVRFRVLPPEKRALNLTEAAKQARVEKAKATRARRRTELSPAVDAAASDVAPADETTGMDAAGQPDTTQIEAMDELTAGAADDDQGNLVPEDVPTGELSPGQAVQEIGDDDAPAARPARRRRNARGADAADVTTTP